MDGKEDGRRFVAFVEIDTRIQMSSHLAGRIRSMDMFAVWMCLRGY